VVGDQGKNIRLGNFCGLCTQPGWISGVMPMQFRTSEIRRKGSRWASLLGENVIALIVATLVLAGYMCLAAIDPATWTFQSNEASHMRSELSHCLTIQDSTMRLRCYDEIARRPPPHPAKGANPLPGTFGQQNR
jgi:hypothetical protein